MPDAAQTPSARQDGGSSLRCFIKSGHEEIAPCRGAWKDASIDHSLCCFQSWRQRSSANAVSAMCAPSGPKLGSTAST